MPNGNDFTTFFFQDPWKPCLINNLQAKTHLNQIKIKFKPFDLVHSDVIIFLIKVLHKATYFINFL